MAAASVPAAVPTTVPSAAVTAAVAAIAVSSMGRAMAVRRRAGSASGEQKSVYRVFADDELLAAA